MARHTLKIVAAGFGGWLLASTAFAATSDEEQSVHVAYSPQELQSEAGIQHLYARLRHAAEQVCGPIDTRNLQALAKQQACVDRALDRAVDSVHSAGLTATHHHHAPAVAKPA